MKKIVAVATLAIVALSFTSCKKYGCTDPDATNFESSVRTDNLMCTYEGSILFWYDRIVQDSLNLLYGPKLGLEYFVEEVRVDSLTLDGELDEPPTCGQEEVATYVADMKTGKKRFVEYKIYTIFEDLIYDSIVEITANECLKIRLL